MAAKAVQENREERIDKVLSSIDVLDPTASMEEEGLLATLTGEEELHLLAERALKGNFKMRYLVLRHLAGFEYESAIRDMVLFLFDENDLIVSEARNALAGIESDYKYECLLPLIDASNPAVSLYAIEAMGKGEQVCAVIPLIEKLEAEHSDTVFNAIDALRLIGDPRSDEPVLACLAHREPNVRYAAAFYCGSRKLPQSCSRLISLADDVNDRVRLAAIWAMGQIPGTHCIESFTSAMRHERNINVRNELFRVLYKKGLLELLASLQGEPVCEPGDGENIKCISDWYFSFLFKEKKREEADICLVVEGSYPYVAGGVSSWVHDLMTSFHDRSFSVVHISTASSEIREFRYAFPPNVRYFNEIYLYEVPERRGRSLASKELKEKLTLIYEFLSTVRQADIQGFEKLIKGLGIPHHLDVGLQELLFSHEAWEFLVMLYDKYTPDLPFLEFSWSYRSIILPLFNLARSALPPARLFYSALTGYAGLACVLAKIEFGRPMMLTEHGIYHRERMLEINRSGWIYEREEDGYIARDISTGLKKVWIDMYYTMSSIAYRFADRITTLYGDNRLMQMEAGANPMKISIIPNGIESQVFSAVKDGQDREEYSTVALVGRVVAIKDIKTFIRACRIVREELGSLVKFKIMGPYDEEKEYADECFALVEMLGLGEVFSFTGNVDLREHLRNVDVMVLTSISEGQPLSLMEAMASGIPCVATNVGASRELLYGRNDEDRKIGHAGAITGVHSPYDTALQILKIVRDPQLGRKMGAAGKERIRRFYERRDVYKLYGAQFDSLISMAPWKKRSDIT
ncbi:MAG: GT4 family glycosyltransferase PelF [Candidatus Eremiobacteraeota bacterium]|nr:GT4 family glycosyltransferase PelF [Candidatus Eremiobacteraeota bacterium]